MSNRCFKSFAGTAAFVAGLLLQTSAAQVFFEDNFNEGGTAGALSRGWEFIENEKVTEVGSNFIIAPEWPEGQDGPGTDTGFINPPTANGTASDGGYLMADSDAGDGSDDVGSEAEIWAISPVFSTVGASQVWFHADTEIEHNNNGECAILFECTVDGGQTWHQIWYGVEPQRPLKAAGANIDGSAITNGYPILGSASQTLSWQGIHGRWHIQLPEIAANKPEVRFRIGFYEPADAWWIALDNVVVDSNPAPMGSEEILFENFENGIPSTWANTTLKTQLWDTRPIWNEEFDEPEKLIQGLPVHIDLIRFAEFNGMTAESLQESIDTQQLDQFANPNGITDGRWLLMLAGQGYALWQEGPNAPAEGEPNEAATLDTPALNLSGAVNVYLDLDSEVLPGNGSVRYEIFVSIDGGQNFERVFTYHEALMDNEEAGYFMHHYFEVPQAAGQSNVIFRFRAEGQDPGNGETGTMAGFWAIDNVRVTVDRTASVGEWSIF